jgi:glucose-1-phosphate adenylyltransferase
MRVTRRSAQQVFLAHDTLALVLAGGSGTRLRELTSHRAKPAVPFGGHYRIVDFTLSNCVNSGIENVALLTQYKAQSLIRHVQRQWHAAGPGLADPIEIWPAQQRRGERWYAGTADAVHQNKDLIAALSPEYVLIVAGDHVYAMDYLPLLEAHVGRGADVTISCVEVPVGEAHAFGIVDVDAERRLRTFAEKPKRPPAGRRGVALASMGIYVFSTGFLFDCLEADARDPASRRDFGYSILPRIAGSAGVYAYVFGAGGERAYWRDVGTVDSYWAAHMDLLAERPGLELDDRRWPLRGGAAAAPPAKLAPTATVAAAMISAGCVVEGHVYRSVVSTGCRIGAGSAIRDSVLLPHVSVGRNCVLERVIVDGRFRIPDGTVIDGGLLDTGAYERTPGGVVLVADRGQGRAIEDQTLKIA